MSITGMMGTPSLADLVSPSPRDLQPGEAKFISMSRIVGGLQEHDVASNDGELPRDVAARHLTSLPFKQKKPLTPAAERLLRVGWQTELAARVGQQIDDPGLRRATLQTLPVQVYYALFNEGRALTAVAGSPRDSHAAIRSVFLSDHIRRFSGSWAVSLEGDPEALAHCRLKPPICTPTSFNPMERRSDSAEYVWAALRLARRRALEESRSIWLANRKNYTKKGQPRKKLPSGVAAQLAAKERATTLLDFIYVLRCNTNYRSVDEYASEVDDVHVRRFHEGLLHVLDLGLLHYEGQIALYAGSSAVGDAFSRWATGIAKLGAWGNEAVGRRLEALKRVGL